MRTCFPERSTYRAFALSRSATSEQLDFFSLFSKEPDDGNGGWVRPKEVGLFKEAPVSDTVSGHHFQSKLELIEGLGKGQCKSRAKNCQHGRRKGR
jgi:hypothetical protein